MSAWARVQTAVKSSSGRAAAPRPARRATSAAAPGRAAEQAAQGGHRWPDGAPHRHVAHRRDEAVVELLDDVGVGAVDSSRSVGASVPPERSPPPGSGMRSMNASTSQFGITYSEYCWNGCRAGCRARARSRSAACSRCAATCPTKPYTPSGPGQPRRVGERVADRQQVVAPVLDDEVRPLGLRRSHTAPRATAAGAPSGAGSRSSARASPTAPS